MLPPISHVGTSWIARSGIRITQIMMPSGWTRVQSGVVAAPGLDPGRGQATAVILVGRWRPQATEGSASRAGCGTTATRTTPTEGRT